MTDEIGRVMSGSSALHIADLQSQVVMTQTSPRLGLLRRRKSERSISAGPSAGLFFCAVNDVLRLMERLGRRRLDGILLEAAENELVCTGK